MKYHTNLNYMKKTQSKKLNSTSLSKLRQLKRQEKMYGTVTIGSRGQIVIPVKARRDFNLATGEQVLIVGNKLTGILGMVKAENLSDFVNKMLKHLTAMGVSEDIREKFKEMFGSIK